MGTIERKKGRIRLILLVAAMLGGGALVVWASLCQLWGSRSGQILTILVAFGMLPILRALAADD